MRSTAEVASGVLTQAEADAIAGTHRHRKQFIKSAHGHGHRKATRHVLAAGEELAVAIGRAGGADTDDSEHVVRHGFPRVELEGAGRSDRPPPAHTPEQETRMERPDEITDDLRKRPRRVAGQVQGVERMLDEGRECRDIVSQISAANRALEQAGFRPRSGPPCTPSKPPVALPLDQAETALRAALADKGFGVLTEIDVAATLSAVDPRELMPDPAFAELAEGAATRLTAALAAVDA